MRRAVVAIRKPWGPRGGSHHGPPDKSNPDFQIRWRAVALTYLQRPLQEFPGVVEPEHVVVILDVVLVEQPVQLIELWAKLRESRTRIVQAWPGERHVG